MKVTSGAADVSKKNGSKNDDSEMNSVTKSGAHAGGLGAQKQHAALEAERLGIISLGHGSFVENSTNEEFWNDAKTVQLYLNHRIPELFAWLIVQYKNSGGVVRARTLQYKMTTRPLNKPWYRGNLNFYIKTTKGTGEIVSPDAMWQEVQPSQFINYVRYVTVPSDEKQVSLAFSCDFDGTHNDGWETTPFQTFAL
ncbi:hypothetical protein [Pseudomonas sp. WC2]|uniref:hypothetical protein n=1 Tax=Pseudomonas sp. WC2 TaxID=3424773 RepID=UPI003D337F6A